MEVGWLQPEFVWGMSGVVIGGILTMLGEWLARRAQNRKDEMARRLAVIENYLPPIVNLYVAVAWQSEEWNPQRNWDNAFPEGGDVRNWYSEVVRLAHHWLLPQDLRNRALDVKKGLEAWSALASDEDTEGRWRLATDLTSKVERLLGEMEGERIS